jgi:putative ABC transport system ATP-binding protein
LRWINRVRGKPQTCRRPRHRLDGGRLTSRNAFQCAAVILPASKAGADDVRLERDQSAIAFAVQGLSKVYASEAGSVHALRGVDLDILAGETLVLLGPSGSGKSTLLNILGGLDRATSGHAVFHGLDLTEASDDQLTAYRRTSVGFIFQFFNLVPSLTARENVALIAEIAVNPMPPEEALAAVGLKARLDHFPAQLSGGEQQRVAVARAIAKRPQVLFCDEPTGSLDSESGALVLEAICDVAAAVGSTTMIVSHNTAISGIADRVVRFRDGRISAIEVNAVKVHPREIGW